MQDALASVIDQLVDEPECMGVVKLIKERTIKKWWQRIEAVKDGRVYVISSDIYTGPRTPGDVDCFAKWLYPQRKH